MKRILIILSALCFLLSSCQKDSPEPNLVSGNKYRWETDMPSVLGIKDSHYYWVFDFVTDDSCESYYTDRYGNVTDLSGTFSYSISGDKISLVNYKGEDAALFVYKTSKCIILTKSYDLTFNYEFFKY